MIQNNQKLEATLTRIRHFQKQIENSEKLKLTRGIMSYPQGVSLPKSIG